MPKIKDIPKIDRPREKLEKYGPGKPSNAELLAILLRTGIKGMNVIDLSKAILRKFPEDKLLNVGIEDLKEIPGLGSAKACEIVAFIELGKRLLKEKKRDLVLSPKDVWEKMSGIRNSKKENFVIFYLDSRNQEIEMEIISVGTLTESLVHPREVFESAVKKNAAAIIVAHNHPSGSVEPSENDISITKKLVHAGKILDIDVLDHIIVTGSEWKSLKMSNIID